MTGKTANFLPNGTSGRVTVKSIKPVQLWKKFEINEWTFTSFLLLTSLTIIFGKLYIKYGTILHQQNNIKYFAHSSVLAVTSGHDFIVKYGDVAGSAVMSTVKAYGWLIIAALWGLMTMGYTWYIIYKDSSLPGINPPIPFSPPKHRLRNTPRVQSNYAFGILIGILTFFFMCL